MRFVGSDGLVDAIFFVECLQDGYEKHSMRCVILERMVWLMLSFL